MIPDDIIGKIVEAGTYAATGMGKQSPLIIAVKDKTARDRLSKLNAEIMGADIDPFYGAPVVLIVLADRSIPTHVYDGSLVMGNLMLAAHALGIGSCWIHRAKEEFERPEGKEILEDLGIEGDYEGIGHWCKSERGSSWNPSYPVDIPLSFSILLRRYCAMASARFLSITEQGLSKTSNTISSMPSNFKRSIH